MKVRIIFDWAGNIYDWWIDWPHPFFPSVGDTFEITSFIDEGFIKNYKNVKFKGRFKYEGLESSILSMLQNCYNTKINNINWMANGAELEITTDLFEKDSILWDEITE